MKELKNGQILPVIILISFLSILGFWQYSIINQVENLERDFREHTLEQEAFLSSINKSLGFGGAIHDFKNYVLRKEDKYRIEATNGFRAVQNTLNEFKKRFPEHSAGADKINFVIKSYEVKLLLIPELIADGKTISEIDSLVKVDDSIAVDGIELIYKQFNAEKEEYFQQLVEKKARLKLLHILTFAIGGLLITLGLLLVLRRMGLASKRELEIAESKDTFVRKMAHEIRTPLNGILGFISILRDERNISKEGQEALGFLDSSSQYLLTLINDIMDFSKLKAGMAVLDPITTNENELIREIESFGVGLKKSNQKFIVEKSGEPLGFSKVDSIKLKQIALNILSNSFKYSQDNGNISLHFQKKKAHYELTFKDDGRDMSKPDLARLFNEFHQSKNNPHSSQVGTGLGMWITSRLIQLMAGEVVVHSQLGEGTIVELTIPIDSSSLPEKKVSSDSLLELQNLKVSVTEDFKVLLVEDNRVNQKLFSKYLERLGVSSFELVNDGLECLKILESSKFDIIFMDLHMPNMDGIEATREIRKKYGCDIKIIGVSANLESRQECINAGMDDFIEKPLSKSRLAQALNLNSSSVAAS